MQIEKRAARRSEDVWAKWRPSGPRFQETRRSRRSWKPTREQEAVEVANREAGCNEEGGSLGEMATLGSQIPEQAREP